jgi:outer membrane protein assembly factor BamB
VLVTEKDSTGKIWDLAIGAGKDKNVYIVNRNDLGKYNSTKNNIYQELTEVVEPIFSTPAVFNNSVYYCGKNSPIQEFQFSDAKLLATPVAETTTSFVPPGATPSISANAGKQGIVWASQNTDPAILDAYNASTLVELYDSTQAPNGRDTFGAGNKNITPMIANGKVYVGTTTGVGAFGLLPSKNQEKK